MSNSIVFLAVAGAGKTYTICNSIDKNKRNLILSFTNENILNISKELIKTHKCIPENTIVMTFDSFLLEYFIWPYLFRIERDFFRLTKSCDKKITLIKQTYDPYCMWKNKLTNKEHYFVKNLNGDYSLILDNCADLVLSGLTFSNGKTLLDLGMNRINMFFDCIYIDEFQDYRQKKYELMCKVMTSIKEGYLYGDYYQHSVSGQNNSGKPFGKNVTYAKFKKELEKMSFKIDDTTLIKTRRCSKSVCEFIRENFSIEIYPEPSMNRKGEVKYIFDSIELKKIMEEENPNILFLDKKSYKRGISFGTSKGNTYDSVVVIIPDKNLIMESGIKKLKVEEGIIKNKLYVAISRSTSNVYLTDKKTINQI